MSRIRALDPVIDVTVRPLSPALQSDRRNRRYRVIERDGAWMRVEILP